MPTIEIVSVNAEPFDLPEYKEFRTRMDTDLVGDRGLFQRQFDQLDGVMVHLGNLKGFWFANQIIEWGQEDGNIKFTPEALSELKDLFQRLLNASPVGRITFSTDLQGGPDPFIAESPVTLEEFWQLHDEKKLFFHDYFEIHAEPLEPSEKSKESE